MIRVYQDGDDGRCFPACIASIVGVPLGDVSPPDPRCGWEQASGFLAGRSLGLGWWPVTSGDVAYEPDADPVEPLAVGVIDGVTGAKHAVVIDRRGRCLHDPGDRGSVIKPGTTARVHAVIGILPGQSDPCPWCQPARRSLTATDGAGAAATARSRPRRSRHQGRAREVAGEATGPGMPSWAELVAVESSRPHYENLMSRYPE